TPIRHDYYVHGTELLDARRLQHDADAVFHRALPPSGIESQHRDVAGVAAAVALEDLCGRRLARAVRTEQCEDFAGLDAQIDAAHGFERTVRLAEPFDVDRN